MTFECFKIEVFVAMFTFNQSILTIFDVTRVVFSLYFLVALRENAQKFLVVTMLLVLDQIFVKKNQLATGLSTFAVNIKLG